jgi:hypothetical protein
MIQFLEDYKGMGKPPLEPLQREELEKLKKEYGKLMNIKKS